MGDHMRYSVVVKGKVQGVFYRASTQEEAKRLGLTGWVKNLPDGNVMLEVQGEGGLVADLIAWCQEGPKLASVSGIFKEQIQTVNETTFEVRY